MKVKQLIELLTSFPDNASVGYRDMNFGGLEKEMDETCVEFDTTIGCVLFDSTLWEPCN